MLEIGCPPTTSKAKLRFESLQFSDVPGQSKLFLRYQSDPLSLSRFYPSVVSSHTELSTRLPEVLDAYSVDRQALCGILAAQNRRFQAGDETFHQIELLGKSDAVAILTGQQTGLFTGPLYTVYKALSAIKMAHCLRGRGINAVPIFWAATEDHDFEEIASAFALGAAGAEVEFTVPTDPQSMDMPVGGIKLTRSFTESIQENLDQLPSTEFSADVRSSLLDCWRAGRTIGEAFCTHLQQMFRRHGLIVVDPTDRELKKLSSPLYSLAVERTDAITSALVTRSKELVDSGYHAQVLVADDYFPLFYHTDDGVRRSVRRAGETYRVTGASIELTAAQLSRVASAEPERLSPGVMLRPVVQDHLFPTLCYFGGGAEIAYFAQNSEVYRLLERPVTPILHRQSFTIVETRHQRTLEKYDLRLTDLFAGVDPVLAEVVERFVNPTTARLFADAEDEINIELNKLDQEIARIDPTLAENLANRRRKILYHIAAVRTKFHRVQVERDEIVSRQLNALFTSLLPGGELQERHLNVVSFTSRYGPYFIDWVYDSVDLDERGHRLLYL